MLEEIPPLLRLAVKQIRSALSTSPPLREARAACPGHLPPAPDTVARQRPVERGHLEDLRAWASGE